MRAAALALAIALAAGCNDPVDPADFPDHSPVGYQGWPVKVEPPGGFVPAHQDSVRRIYVNSIGASYPHAGRYPIGTVIVKEVFHRNADGTAGDLFEVAIMRKVGDGADVKAPVFGGWVFSDVPAIADVGVKEERALDSCWQSCHRAAPWDGAWLDYGQ